MEPTLQCRIDKIVRLSCLLLAYRLDGVSDCFPNHSKELLGVDGSCMAMTCDLKLLDRGWIY